ncbi:lytic murein transglycosylase [Shewanella mangrovi]|uniref:Lytic murein transglycosylase n=1 Tax=Shewanella mangrovi TaxID=1515746 RepID=A0A094JB37_9GAMM|nr:lytic murein transglycosylase B [Shewanella mangrovi]KFZ36437.1 lytic murein transglycosylase [Shewanella mangrovi]
MPMTKRLLAPLMMSALLASSAFAAPSSEQLSPEQLQQQFIDSQSQQGFSRTEVQQFIASAKFEPKIIEAMTKPWEAKPWYKYYPIFLTDDRLQAGLTFWRQHETTIARAAEQYQVDPQVIVAIIGIETKYGKVMGNYPVKDALYTLGFHYPPRADFFRREFGKFMQLVKAEQLDANSTLGSYAGAMGFGQFIPSSYLAYAVDFDGDGRRDLLNSADDAIGSVANYFHQHGWQAGGLVALPLATTATPTAAVWSGKPLNQSVNDILSPEVALQTSVDLDISQAAMLIELEQAQHSDYWLGLKNFYVITRYNRSPLYAMAVYQFSEQLRKAHASQ